MHPDLESLLNLQEKDKTVDAVKVSIEALTPEQQALDDELAQHAQALADAQRAASGAEARKVELEGRIAGYKSLQERRRQQLEFVRGAKEASTLTAEIDMARGVLIKEEADFLRSGDAIVEAEKRVKDAEKAHAAAIEKQVEPRAALAQKREELDAQLALAQSERADAAKDVKVPLLAKYERIRRGRAPLAVFPLSHNACGHCYTAVPTQRRMLVQQGQSIESCEVCGVLLYAAEA
ncbi:MAG: zinc ribbon domain-containing protein [Gemmatimonadales bacterium]